MPSGPCHAPCYFLSGLLLLTHISFLAAFSLLHTDFLVASAAAVPLSRLLSLLCDLCSLLSAVQSFRFKTDRCQRKAFHCACCTSIGSNIGGGKPADWLLGFSSGLCISSHHRLACLEKLLIEAWRGGFNVYATAHFYRKVLFGPQHLHGHLCNLFYFLLQGTQCPVCPLWTSDMQVTQSYMHKEHLYTQEKNNIPNRKRYLLLFSYE